MRNTGAWAAGVLGACGIALLGVLLLPIILVTTLISGGGLCGGNLTDILPGSGVLPAKATAAANPGKIPENYFKLYRQAGRTWNIPWQVLAGIGKVESDHGRSTLKGVHYGENYAGAAGPMQFISETWAWAKVKDAKSRYDPADAIFSAARLLKLHILPGGSDTELKNRTLTKKEIRSSLYSYNHSWDYVNNVLANANYYYQKYGMGGGQDLAPANYAGFDCTSFLPISLQNGSFGQRIANAAAYYAFPEKGTPRLKKHHGEKVKYSWGGGNARGPDRGICCSPGGYDGADRVGFDCSGLVQYVVYQASNGKINLSPPASAQWHSGKGAKVSRKQLAPGDLVFFNNLNHVAIYFGEFNGTRWMVEAPQTWLIQNGRKVPGYVKFSDFDARARGSYVGALRITPPPGMKTKSPDTIRAMAPTGAVVGAGAM